MYQVSVEGSASDLVRQPVVAVRVCQGGKEINGRKSFVNEITREEYPNCKG